MWIDVDLYDANGNVTGQTSLNFSPESGKSPYQLYNPSDITYPRWMGCNIKSGKKADEELLKRWTDMQTNPKIYPPFNVIPNNCITCTMKNIGIGLPQAPGYSGGGANLP